MAGPGSKASLEFVDGETILEVYEGSTAEQQAAGQPTDQLTASSEVQPKPTTTPSLSLEQGLEREVSASSSSPQSPLLPPIPPENETTQPEFNIITAFLGVPHIVEDFLSYLDVDSLLRAQQVCKHWRWVIASLPVWKHHVQYRARNDSLWRNLFERRGWSKYLSGDAKDYNFYRDLCSCVCKDINSLENNWRKGNYSERRVKFDSYIRCLRCDEKKIVAGFEDGSIKIYDRKTLAVMTVLRRKPHSPVQCVDFNDVVVISGSEDRCIRVWDITGSAIPQKVLKVERHERAIRALKLAGNTLVTGSEDGKVLIWEVKFKCPTAAYVKKTKKHGYAVYAVDINESYIVSGSGDSTIKVWDAFTYGMLHKFAGHCSVVSCLQLRGHHLVSGSLDKTLRVWNVESGECLRTLGHEGLFWDGISVTDNRICSNADDKTVKVWDFRKAVNKIVPDSAEFCLSTLKEQDLGIQCHGLHCDDFELVLGNIHGILVWDFSSGLTLEGLYS